MIIRIDPAREAFLADHVVDGTPILPTVMGLDLLVRCTGLLADQQTAVVIHDVLVGRPVRLTAPREVEAVAVPASVATDDGDTWDCRLLSGEPAATHLSARIGGREMVPRRVPPPARSSAHPQVGADSVYPPYFHGPIFQVVGSFWRSGDGFEAAMADGLAPLHWSRSDPRLRPLLLELFMQACGLVALADSGRLMIPSRIETLIWFPDALHNNGGPTQRPTCAQVTASCTARDTFDGQLIDAEGRVLLAVGGYQTVDLGHLPLLDLAAHLRRQLSSHPTPLEGASR